MTDPELIGYCELHCKTERALFFCSHLNQMIALAGHPKEYIYPLAGWYSVHEDQMMPLVELARKNMEAKP